MRIEENPVGRIEKLARFQYHLDYVFVDMPARGFARFPMEDKDIHSGGLSAPHTPSRRISNFLGITLSGFQIFLALLSAGSKFSWSE